MLMLADSPTNDFFAQRKTRDSGVSPSFRPRVCTPPRLVPTSSDRPSYDSPVLTPSPLRQRPLFPTAFNPHVNDLFLQSPYKSPPPLHPHPMATSKHHPIVPDDDDGSIFLSSPSTSSSFSPFFPPSSSQPLRTPVKQIHRMPSRPALPPSRLSSPAFLDQPDLSYDAHTPAPNVGAGMKRKSTPHLNATPVRSYGRAPPSLPLSSVTNSARVDRFAPFSVPKFVAATPQTKAETDAYLKRQTTTLTRLSITDPKNSPDEFSRLDNDSGCEMDDDEAFRGTSLFGLASVHEASPAYEILRAKAKERDKEEVAEAISPGGHIIKRRARRRPLSAELRESTRQSSPNKHITRARHSGIAFPTTAHSRKRASSPSSESEPGSPLPRRRIGNTLHPPKPTPQPLRAAGLSRQDNLSAASLFFGPSIPSGSKSAPIRSRTNTMSSTSGAPPHSAGGVPKTNNRHSYAGPGGSTADLDPWNTIQSKAALLSPESSPPAIPTVRSHTDDEEDMFFGSGPRNSSFIFSVTEDTPPPRKRVDPETLPRKYKPRDSGVVMMSDDDDDDSMCTTGDYEFIHMPPPPLPYISTTGPFMHPDVNVSLVTPAFGPTASSGWPGVPVTGDDRSDVDAFIRRTLAVASKGPGNAQQRIPGTPVKKTKTQYLAGGARPWQSAVAAKVGLRFDWDTKKGKVPRQSLPAAFPAFGKKPERLSLDQDSDSDDGGEESPGQRRAKYVGLGLGRPPVPQNGLKTRTRWLMRRSSSGAFSSGSESISSLGTPTRRKDSHLPSTLGPAPNTLKLPAGRTTSGSSSSSASTATLNSPSVPASRRSTVGIGSRPHDIQRPRRLSAEEQTGRFERDFMVDDEVGSGEFGKVIKVHRKNCDSGEVFAIKKSKRFEGPRHRLRLREEVEILQHLSQIASRTIYDRNRHPNVLAYIDSWEEDEALYIQTELCESGNLAQFLWEFGRAYPRLDEDRVWKILVDLSNGLRFIHDAGVIHLDLKPSNIFLTAEGRFKIGDFGMASLWPRPSQPDMPGHTAGFEREGDKLYLAPEVLQGVYSKAADMFSLGMTILETAANIVVPDQGEAWHRLRREDFSQVDLDGSPELLELIRQMMRTEPSLRMGVHAVCNHPVVSRARAIMERMYLAAKRNGTSLFAASPLGSVPQGFLEEVHGRRRVESGAMDVSV